jgi:L,D-transpeptidase YbiS
VTRGALRGLAAAVAAAALAALWMARHGREPGPPPPDLTPLTAAEKRELESLARRAESLERAIEARRPRGTYIVIDTGRNLLTLHENGRPARSAVCSTGSGRALSDPERDRMWVFDTPRGEFYILNKWPNPVWIKPDWAFLEVGEPIPRSLAERLAPAELGEYAMDLGDGYLIHGTLYQRALGLSITHGCVRLGDDDLEAVYRKVRIGTPVYIY